MLFNKYFRKKPGFWAPAHNQRLKVSLRALREAIAETRIASYLAMTDVDERGLTQVECGIVNFLLLIPTILELKQAALLVGKRRNNTLSKRLCKPSDLMAHR